MQYRKTAVREHQRTKGVHRAVPPAHTVQEPHPAACSPGAGSVSPGSMSGQVRYTLLTLQTESFLQKVTIQKI